VGNVFWDTSEEFARLPILLRPPSASDGQFRQRDPAGSDIKGELLGLEENHRALEEPADPHALEDNGYTRIENMLFEMAREVEGTK